MAKDLEQYEDTMEFLAVVQAGVEGCRRLVGALNTPAGLAVQKKLLRNLKKQKVSPAVITAVKEAKEIAQAVVDTAQEVQDGNGG